MLFDASLLVIVHTSKVRVVNTLAHFPMLHICNVYLVSATTVSDIILFIFVTELWDGKLRDSFAQSHVEVCGRPGSSLVFHFLGEQSDKCYLCVCVILSFFWW